MPAAQDPHPRITLARTGAIAELVPDPYVPGSLILEVDGTPQSQVDPEDPTQLFFEYVRRIGHVIDLMRAPGSPITAVHLGGGAMTLPRYVAATRPGSRQQVLELEPDLIDFVRAHLPLPRGTQVRVRYGDARAGLSKLPPALHGSVDLVVIDVFSGARTPAHLTSVEFYQQVFALLAPDGIVVANIADGPGLAFARRQAATMMSVAEDTTILAEAGILKGRRFGNLVLVGSPSALPTEWLPRLLAGGPHPAKVMSKVELRNFVAGASIVTDATAIDSPTPRREIF